MNSAYVYIIVLSILGIVSCKKQEIGPQCPTCITEFYESTNEVIVGCEGNFGWGNGSISIYNPLAKTTSNSVFQNINGYGLGDVVNSFTLIGNELVVVVNNSSKIEFLDTSNYQSNGVITGFNSPRHTLQINNQKGYVTDLYSGTISIFNPQIKQITGAISTNQWTDRLYQFDSEVYVCAPDTNWVLIIDPVTDQITDTLHLTKGPNSIVKDANNMLWILCSGGLSEEFGALYKVNPVTKQVVQTLSFSDLTESPNNLLITSLKDKLIFLNQSIFEMEINSTSLPANPIIGNGGATLYGMNLDPISNDLYVTDAKDYVQSGAVIRFDSTYNPLDTFQVGIIPQAIWFK